MTEQQETRPACGRKTQQAPAIKEVHILWITQGLGSNGDTGSITAASEPSIEDIILGAVPGTAKSSSA
jgi:hydrogenase small subunit